MKIQWDWTYMLHMIYERVQGVSHEMHISTQYNCTNKHIEHVIYIGPLYDSL